ncbi:MAG: DUF6152 family protein [Arenicellaceae bacterium]|nr:DUF6152 family protein [Arenicellaceae bacterium]
MKIRLTTALLTLFAIVEPSFPHHSYINIDRTTIIGFEAAVLDFQWRNPHAYAPVEVEENDRMEN